MRSQYATLTLRRQQPRSSGTPPGSRHMDYIGKGMAAQGTKKSCVGAGRPKSRTARPVKFSIFVNERSQFVSKYSQIRSIRQSIRAILIKLGRQYFLYSQLFAYFSYIRAVNNDTDKMRRPSGRSLSGLPPGPCHAQIVGNQAGGKWQLRRVESTAGTHCGARNRLAAHSPGAA